MAPPTNPHPQTPLQNLHEPLPVVFTTLILCTPNHIYSSPPWPQAHLNYLLMLGLYHHQPMLCINIQTQQFFNENRQYLYTRQRVESYYYLPDDTNEHDELLQTSYAA